MRLPQRRRLVLGVLTLLVVAPFAAPAVDAGGPATRYVVVLRDTIPVDGYTRAARTHHRIRAGLRYQHALAGLRGAADPGPAERPRA